MGYEQKPGTVSSPAKGGSFESTLQTQEALYTNEASGFAADASLSATNAANASRLTIGTTTTLAGGSSATATITGPSGSQLLNLGIPQGFDAVTSIIIAASDETSALVVGAGKVTFRMPFSFTLSSVRCSTNVAPIGSVLTVNVKHNGSSIFSTKVTIDAAEKTSTTAAIPSVLSLTALSDDAEISIDLDTVGSSVAGAGLKVYLIGVKT